MNELESEMCDGFRDGYDLNVPMPGPNRSAAYRHGFLNGRDDMAGFPRDSAANLRAKAAAILAGDTQ